MVHLIDKDALVERIKKLKMDIGNIVNEYDEGFWEGRNTAFDDVNCAIDTLEVKEVDLMMHTIIAEGCDWLALHTKLNHNEIEDCRNLMLTIKDEQLKAQKGEPKKYMYSKDDYTDEGRKVLCDGCEEECKLKTSKPYD